MELKEVLAQVPKLHKRFVYYLESQGYIHPTKLRRLRISRRDYSHEDLRVVKEMWRYYQRGYAVQAAYDLITRPDRVVSYVMLQAPQGRWHELLDALRDQQEVIEASAVYGVDLDCIAKIDTPEEGEVYHVLWPVLRAVGLVGTPTVLRVTRHLRREEATVQGSNNMMMAYVLMRVPGKDAPQVMDRLKDLSSIVEAATVYGETDIIAKVVVSSQHELDELVMETLHGIPAVESTRTFIVIGGLHWRREAALQP